MDKININTKDPEIRQALVVRSHNKFPRIFQKSAYTRFDKNGYRKRLEKLGKAQNWMEKDHSQEPLGLYT